MDDGQSMFGWKFSKEPMLHSLTWLLGCMSLSVLGPIIGIKLLYKVFSGIINQHRYGKAQFNGKVVVITGASSGLGAALSHHLYSKGCRLILASRNITALNELKKTLINTYDLPHLHIPTVIHLDLETLDDIPNVVSKIFDTHHHVDVLINNAGMSYRGEIMQTDASVHLKLMLVNYLGQVVLTKGILTKMIARRSGHVIGVSSVQGKVAIPFRSSYSASKHAFQSFMDTLRSEVAKDNIDVTTISPGYINTNLSLNAVTGSGTNYGVMDDNTAKGMSADYVAERIAKCMVTKEKDLVLAPLFAKIVIYFRVLCPTLYFFGMRKWALSSKPKEKEL